MALENQHQSREDHDSTNKLPASGKHKRLCTVNWDHGMKHGQAVLARLEDGVQAWKAGGGSPSPNVEEALKNIANVVNDGLKY